MGGWFGSVLDASLALLDCSQKRLILIALGSCNAVGVRAIVMAVSRLRTMCSLMTKSQPSDPDSALPEQLLPEQLLPEQSSPQQASKEDPSSQAVSPQHVATAFHEAGHAVMAMIVGRPIQKVTITAANIQTGGVRLGAVKIQKGRSKATNDWLEDEVLILLAGMVAEAHFTEQYCRQGASHDLQAVRQLLASRASNERQLEKLERRMLDKTEHLLSQDAYSAAIKSIALELLQKQTISGRAVKHHFNQAEQRFRGT